MSGVDGMRPQNLNKEMLMLSLYDSLKLFVSTRLSRMSIA